jgi:uncharacterized protein (TIGR02466 family)
MCFPVPQLPLKPTMSHPNAPHANGPESDLLQRAVALQQAGDLIAAEALALRALKASPRTAQIWHRLASVQEDLGQWSKAEASWKRACELRPNFVEAHYNCARMLRLLGRGELAFEALRQADRHAQASGDQLRGPRLQLQALLEEESGQLEAALETLDFAVALSPQRAALHHNRGALLQRLARSSEALAAHERAIELGLDAADAHYNRGNSLQSLGRMNEALDAYRAALKLQPQHGLSLYDITRLRWRLGDKAYCEELDAAIAADPSSALALGIKGRLMLRGEQYEAAATSFLAATQIAPGVAGYFDGLGQALNRLGRTEAALAALRRAVALAPEQSATHINLASCLLQACDVGAAEQSAEAAVRLEPLDQQAWATLGLVWRASSEVADLAADARDLWLNDYERHVRVFDLPPPESWDDMLSFNAALASALEQLHTDTRAPIDQTLRHGSQTMGNVFEKSHPLLAQLKSRISQAIDQYLGLLSALPRDDGHPLMGRIAAGWRFSDSWSSRLRSGGFHTPHVHPHGWISSCYYVAVPPSVADGSSSGMAGWLSLGQPDITIAGQELIPQRAVQPRVGRLVLFPSFMWHCTLPFTANEPRLTVAFDVLPT